MTEPDNRPGAEISVTPAMVQAGVAAFLKHDHRFEGEEELVVKVYRAMRLAER